MFLCHIDVCLSPLLSLSKSNENKSVLGWGLKNSNQKFRNYKIRTYYICLHEKILQVKNIKAKLKDNKLEKTFAILIIYKGLIKELPHIDKKDQVLCEKHNRQITKKS